jgi:hypothetical protein
MHKGEELRAAGSNLAKARLAQAWQEKARDAWYAGLEKAIRDGARRGQEEANARTEWGKSYRAKELAGLEQMYARWASLYYSASTADAREKAEAREFGKNRIHINEVPPKPQVIVVHPDGPGGGMRA